MTVAADRLDEQARTGNGAGTIDNTYNAHHLLVLEGLEAVRKRPGMYIGSTDTRGLMHCLWEIIDNAVDEALGGLCTHIDVTLHADGSAEVRDDGRGIPVDKEPKTGLLGRRGGLHQAARRRQVRRRLLRRDRRPARRRRLGGQRAVGAARRRGRPLAGHPGDVASSAARRASSTATAPTAPFTPRSGLRKGGRVKKGVTGTRIRFWPDRQIFTKDATFTFDELVNRARQTSFLVPGLELVIRDLRGDRAGRGEVPSRRRDRGVLRVPGARRAGHRRPAGSRAASRFTETVPMLDDDGHMTPQDVERDLDVDVALRWGTGYDTELRSFVNVIATPKGGTHVAGFERALTKTFNERAARDPAAQGQRADVVKDDVLEGLTAVVTVRLAEPQFEGQTKEVLGTPGRTLRRHARWWPRS